MANPDRVRVTGPLAAFKDGFAAELVRQGYRPNAVACQLQLMAHLSRWMALRGVDAAGLTAPVMAEFLLLDVTPGMCCGCRQRHWRR